MSYQVLARKWRPAKFAQLVGQQHVKDALINGLTNQRLHHAYLFTGTRGVGKTTIARIFAKSLNCETGITAEPCGQCDTCIDVDQGRFVDLIEIDAASRTKVSDTREILDNVQYSPTRGRYKVYLIDEVHMLSRHSFNALLKTLEEPPEHVKFLLATTDPQKLPVTILSRCLQFNLQALTVDQIIEQLRFVLEKERIVFEFSALELIARSARGSMRDALSLTDQAIAQSAGQLQLQLVQTMLGTVDSNWSQNLLTAVINGDAELLVSIFEKLRLQQPDAMRVLDDLIELTHQIALAQVLPLASKLNITHVNYIDDIKEQVSAEIIQVYYHFLLQGKKELPLLADRLSGLEMVCLRLLAFRPSDQFVSTNNTVLKASNEVATSSEASAANSEQELNKVIEQGEPSLSNQPETTVSTQNEVPSEFNDEYQQDLQTQEAFYHDMALSQGFRGESNTYQSQGLTKEQQVESVKSDQQLDSEPKFVTEESTNNNQSIDSDDAAYQDNPALAILALREQEQKKTLNNGEESKQVNSEAEQQTSEQVQLPETSELKDIQSDEVKFAHEVDEWAQLIEHSDIAGLARQLALNSAVDIKPNTIELTVKQDFSHLLNEKSEAELRKVVELLAPNQEFIINKSQIIQQSPAAIQVEINENRQQRAEQSIDNDPIVQAIVQDFGGRIVPDSVKPL